MFIAPAKWLLLQDRRTILDEERANLTLTYDDSIFENMAVYPDSDIVMAQRFDRDFVQLTSVYRPSPQRGTIWEDRGNWTLEDGLRVRSVKVTSERRKNLQSTALKSCLVVRIWITKGQRGNCKLSGYLNRETQIAHSLSPLLFLTRAM